MSLPDDNVVCFTRHEPIGVCGAITPVSTAAFLVRSVDPTPLHFGLWNQSLMGFHCTGASGASQCGVDPDAWGPRWIRPHSNSRNAAEDTWIPTRGVRNGQLPLGRRLSTGP